MREREPASFWLEDVIGLVVRHHSTTSFSENVVVVQASYQMLEVLSFCDREITVLTFLVKNIKMITEN